MTDAEDVIVVPLEFDEIEEAQDSQPQKSQRQKRTRGTQKEIYISFAEVHPQVLDNNDKNYGSQWKALTEELNRIEPKKPTHMWQKNLKEWEYALKTKYRNSQKNNQLLSNFEMRALRVFGEIKLTGNPDLPTLGVPCSSSSRNHQPMTNINLNVDDDDEDDDVQELAPKKKPRRDTDDGTMKEILKVISEQNKTNARNAESFATLANAVMIMAQSVAGTSGTPATNNNSSTDS